MKKKFETPELLIILFPSEDVIVTSTQGLGGDEGQPGDDGSGNYPY